MEKFFHWINVFALPDNLAKCGVDNEQKKCSSERKISSVTVLEQDLKKPA